MRAALAALLLAACGPKLGPPAVEYGEVEPLPMVHTSRDASRWYVLVDTVTHGERLFFLDSGFARTTCDDDFVDELGLDTRGLVFVRGVGGTLLATKARLPVLHAGGHRLERFACIVRDLDTTSSIRDPVDSEIAGVIGADLLTRFVTDIDAVGGQVRLIPPHEAEALSGPGTVRLRRSGPGGVRFMVEAAVEGESGWWLLDTGARGSHLDGADYGLAPTSTQQDAWIGGTGRGGGKRQDLHFYDDVTVELAGHAIRELRLVDRPHGPFGFDLLGLNVLAHYRIWLDPGARTARFVPSERVSLPQATDVEAEAATVDQAP